MLLLEHQRRCYSRDACDVPYNATLRKETYRGDVCDYIDDIDGEKNSKI